MVVIYFSGTGNSEYCARNFLKRYNGDSTIYSIEQEETTGKIKDSREIVICYPVQFSNIPKILYDYIVNHKDIWNNKKIFIIATMGLFSGDGAGILARLLKKYGAVIYGGLHVKMPDSICDEKALKRTYKKNKAIVQKADAIWLDYLDRGFISIIKQKIIRTNLKSTARSVLAVDYVQKYALWKTFHLIKELLLLVINAQCVTGALTNVQGRLLPCLEKK